MNLIDINVLMILLLTENRRERLNKKALLVWSPTDNISEHKCINFKL